MRILLVSLLLLALPAWALADADDMAASGGDDSTAAAASTASAGDWDAGCLVVPNGCSIDCIGIELACCKNPCECPEGKEATLRVEFMDKDGNVIATGDVTNNWCNPCQPCRVGPLATFGSLDKAINPCDIATARLSVVDGPADGINVKTLVLWVRDPQGRLGVCEKWYKAWKCSPPCCQVLGGGTNWTFTSNGCCRPCGNPCGCNKCASKCNSCNKCGTSKCGCDKCAAKPACGCNKCASKASCNTCNKCAMKPTCGCNKCATKASCNTCNTCKSKCNSCAAKPACGCNKCATTKCGCNKCDKCSAKPACGCSKCAETKCGCNKCDKCSAKPACACGH